MFGHDPTPAELAGGPASITPELLDVRQVAALLNCSPRHVHRMHDAGRMPRGVKFGALLRWRRADLVRWLDARCSPVAAVEG